MTRLSPFPVGRVAALLALTVALAGCGVRPTGVVDAGEPAKGPAPQSSDGADSAGQFGPGMVLFFVRGNALVPSVRQGQPADSPQVALQFLVKGTDARERALGMFSELPSDTGVLQLGQQGNGTITVFMESDPNALSDRAARQIICTLGATQLAKFTVTLAGSNGESRTEPPCGTDQSVPATPFPSTSPPNG
jgi:hypothetical protein